MIKKAGLLLGAAVLSSAAMAQDPVSEDGTNEVDIIGACTIITKGIDFGEHPTPITDPVENVATVHGNDASDTLDFTIGLPNVNIPVISGIVAGLGDAVNTAVAQIATNLLAANPGVFAACNAPFATITVTAQNSGDVLTLDDGSGTMDNPPTLTGSMEDGVDSVAYTMDFAPSALGDVIGTALDPVITILDAADAVVGPLGVDLSLTVPNFRLFDATGTLTGNQQPELGTYTETITGTVNF